MYWLTRDSRCPSPLLRTCDHREFEHCMLAILHSTADSFMTFQKTFPGVYDFIVKIIWQCFRMLRNLNTHVSHLIFASIIHFYSTYCILLFICLLGVNHNLTTVKNQLQRNSHELVTHKHIWPVYTAHTVRSIKAIIYMFSQLFKNIVSLILLFILQLCKRKKIAPITKTAILIFQQDN